jgi:hypothetical protein
MDAYTRRNIAALTTLGCGGVRTMDPRIAAALCRRHLIFEDGPGQWHLTQAGQQAVDDYYAEQAHTQEERPHDQH